MMSLPRRWSGAREQDREWRRAPMTLHSNDRWGGSFVPDAPGRYVYAIEAWTDEFATWRHGFELKQKAGADLTLDAIEGAGMLTKAQAGGQAAAAVILRQCEDFLQTGDAAPLLTDELKDAMAESQSRPDLTRSQLFPFVADRPRARNGAWYEMVPRSQGVHPGQHGTFKDCIARLPDVAAMGFDVVYLTPIHPIGQDQPQGPQQCGDGGGRRSRQPLRHRLGRRRPRCGASGIGHAGGFPRLRRGVQSSSTWKSRSISPCSVRPTIPGSRTIRNGSGNGRTDRCAMRKIRRRNTKTSSIPDFASEDAGALWNALRDVILFWIDQGVKIFRVDNPHTKPFRFWEWLIHEVQLHHPDVIFLAEAFTRPKLMKGLAKLGFTQSYTYFTWRTQKWELEQYLIELTALSGARLLSPEFLRQYARHPALSSAERRDLDVQIPRGAGRHAVEHLRRLQRLRTAGARADSRQGRISRFREIRDQGAGLGQARQHQALSRAISTARAATTRRCSRPAICASSRVEDGNVIAFVKESVNQTNSVIAAIALSRDVHEFWLPLGDVQVGMADDRRNVAAVENLITGERYPVEWGGIRLRIDPVRDPALLFRCLA